GLTRHVRPGEIADIALRDQEPEKISQQLIDLANARGGEDNISVVVVVVEGDNTESSVSATIEAENEDDTILLTERPRFRRDEITGRMVIEENASDQDLS